MRADVFLDTDILIYAISSDASHSEKTTVALNLIGSSDFGISTQVMNEFYVTATQTLKQPLTHEQASLSSRNCTSCRL